MFVGLLVCLASLLQTAMTRSVECPICGLRADYQTTFVDPRATRAEDDVHFLELYYCEPCDMGVMR
jgi:hypothetical protein